MTQVWAVEEIFEQHVYDLFDFVGHLACNSVVHLACFCLVYMKSWLHWIGLLEDLELVGGNNEVQKVQVAHYFLVGSTKMRVPTSVTITPTNYWLTFHII